MTFLFVLSVGLGTIMMISAIDNVSMRLEFQAIISGQWHANTQNNTQANVNTTPNGGNSGSGPLLLPRR